MESTSFKVDIEEYLGWEMLLQPLLENTILHNNCILSAWVIIGANKYLLSESKHYGRYFHKHLSHIIFITIRCDGYYHPLVTDDKIET